MLLQDLVDLLSTKGHVLEYRNKEWYLKGFYKSNEVKLTGMPDMGYVLATMRYGETEELYSYDDLVHLNYRWWIAYRDRNQSWNAPDRLFQEDMVRLNLAKQVTAWEPTGGNIR